MSVEGHFYGFMNTPLGDLKVVANEEAVLEVVFVDNQNEDGGNANELVNKALQQLTEYFKGQRQVFDLPLGASGTEFRQLVWQQLCEVPFGQTASYSDIATAIGKDKAVRAVAAANGANPIAIVVPCHRVIGKNGTLTGYAGGLNRKQWLLEFELSSTH